MDLLKSITDFILDKKFSVVGVVYIQRINERRLTGSTRSNLRMLHTICGEHFYQNITLISSMWTTLPREEYDEAYQRELEFIQAPTFWGELKDKGANYFRWDETEQIQGAKTAREILKVCERKLEAPSLNVLLELDKGSVLEDTAAGKILTEEIRKRQEKELQRLLEEQEELKALQEQREELEAIAAGTQDAIRRERRSQRRLSVCSSSSTALQSAQTAYRRREPVVYPSPPSPTRQSSSRSSTHIYDGDDVPPPPYSYSERIHSDRIESAAPPARLERRYTGGGQIFEAATLRDEDLRDVVNAHDDHDRNDSRRGRRSRGKKKSGWAGVGSYFMGESDIVLVRKPKRRY